MKNGQEADNAVDYQEVHQKFCEWLATPSAFRMPATQKEFARLFGVSENHLTNLKKRDDTWDIVKGITRSDLIARDAPDVFRAIVKAAKKGSPSHARLFIEITGYRFDTPKQVKPQEAKKAKEPISSDGDEIDAEIRRLLKQTKIS